MQFGLVMEREHLRERIDQRVDQMWDKGFVAEVDKLIEDGWGFFNGLTMVSYRGYDGELPRMDGDTSAYDEFNITYKGILINEMTYGELQNLILADSRDMKIDSLNGL
jgi:tRNA A37 N6-isopentenylltransferase MiaA